MFQKKTIRDIEITNQVVLLRTDYNVPLQDGRITDDFRIRASLPTLTYLLENGAKKVIIISHLGRPDGTPRPELSLAPIAKHLQTLLPQYPVQFVPAFSGQVVENSVENSPEPSVLLLENLRFSPEEEANSAEFASSLVHATKATLFVQDGFAVVHRAHASTSAITRLLPSVAGLLVEQEVSTLSSAIDNPEKPVVILIGGAKVADKQPLIDRFLPLADNIIIGGKIAADGYHSSSPQILVANTFLTDASGAKLDVSAEFTTMVLDLLRSAKTVVWNGVFGKTEDPDFAKSSTAIATFLGGNPHCRTIIGGGDTAGFVRDLKHQHPELNYSLISTGGGASLELLSGLPLPGVDSLLDR